ncbi:MAG: PAS domain S-box protein [Thermodesulfobacteriota bacterium]
MPQQTNTDDLLRELARLRRVEAELRESEQDYRNLFESMALGVFRQRADGNLADVNERALEIFGLSREQFQCLTSPGSGRGLIREDGSSLQKDGLPSTRALFTGRPVTDEILGVFHPGKNDFVWICVNAMPRFRQGEDKPFEVLVTLHDVTGRKRAEEAYGTLCRMASQLICIADIENARFLQVNPAFERVLGYSEEELLSRSFLDFVHPEDVDKTVAVIRDNLRQGAEVISFENRYRCKDGSYRRLEWNSHPLPAEGKTCAIANDITDRRQTEEAVLEMTHKLRLAMESAREGTWEWDLANDIVSFDEVGLSMLGYGEAEMRRTGGWWFGRVHPEDRPFVETRFEDYLEGRIPGFRAEFRLLRKDGGYIWIVSNGRVVRRDSEGRPLLCVGIHRDITDRKKAEEHLRISEDKFAKAFRSSPDAFILSSVPDRVVVDVNPSACRITEYSMEEMLGRTTGELGLWADPEERNRFVALVERDGRVVNFEAHFRTKSGRIIVGLLSGETVPLWEGDCFLSVVKDITERKRAEEELKESEERLELVLKGSRLGFWDWNLETGEVRRNERWAEMLGYRLEEMDFTVRQWLDLIHPEDREKANQSIQDHLEGKTPIHRIEYRMLSKDGQHRWILDQAQVVKRDARGQPLRMSGTHTDITDRKLAEHRAKELEENLQHARKLEAIGRLAGGVAHDFNNMLGVILGHAEMAMETVEPSQPLREDLEEIRKAAQRSSDLTKQLLAFARRQTINPRLLNLNETVSGMLKMLRRIIGEGIELSWEPGEGLWPVKMDPVQLDQVLANLSINARDAMDGVGRLSIRTENRELVFGVGDDHPPGRYVLLTVSDTGCGLDREAVEHLFEPFYTTKEMGKGTGLGLATVYGIVQQNNGFIAVESEPGRGTSFVIWLPRASEEEVSQADKAPEAPGRGEETILLVEDEPAFLNLTKMMLERCGYKVLPAATPGEALALAENHDGPIHLVVTDVIMPLMNGKALLEKISAIRPEAAALFMSGYSEEVIAGHGAMEEGFVRIHKPFTMRSLALKVKEALGKE